MYDVSEEFCSREENKDSKISNLRSHPRLDFVFQDYDLSLNPKVVNPWLHTFEIILFE